MVKRLTGHYQRACPLDNPRNRSARPCSRRNGRSPERVAQTSPDGRARAAHATDSGRAGHWVHDHEEDAPASVSRSASVGRDGRTAHQFAGPSARGAQQSAGDERERRQRRRRGGNSAQRPALEERPTARARRPRRRDRSDVPLVEAGLASAAGRSGPVSGQCSPRPRRIRSQEGADEPPEQLRVGDGGGRARDQRVPASLRRRQVVLARLVEGARKVASPPARSRFRRLPCRRGRLSRRPSESARRTK